VIGGNNSGALQAWQTNPTSLPAVRATASSVTANGYVYMIGGDDGTGNGMTTSYYAKLNADGSTGAWNTTTALPTAAGRTDHTSVVANGYVYVLAGDKGAGNAMTTVLYAKLNTNGTIGSWYCQGQTATSTNPDYCGSSGATVTNTNTLPSDRRFHSSVVMNGYVYVIGGEKTSATAATATSTTYYAKLNADGSTGAWSTATASINTTNGVAVQSSVVANGYIYSIGGIDKNSTAVTNVYYAQPTSTGDITSWSTSTNALPLTRYRTTAVVANGYVYVIGGANGVASVNSVLFAKLNSDGNNGAWSCQGTSATTSCNTASIVNGNNVPAALWSGSSVIYNGYVYFLGGYTGAASVSSVYYTSTQRILVGGSLDLVGLSAQNAYDSGDGSAGSTGGSLTAGNTNIVGSFQVQGQALFTQGANVTGNFSVGGSIAVLSVDTTSNKVQIGSSTTDANAALLVLDSYNTTDPTGVNGAMYYSTSTNSFRCYQNDVWVSCVGGLLFANTSIPGGNTFASSTAENNFASNYVLPANYCVPGRVIRVTAQGTYGNSSGGQLTLKVKFGTTVIGATPGTATPTPGPAREWRMDYQITCDTTGASGTVEGQGIFYFFSTSTGSTDVEMLNTAAVPSINTTTTQTLQLSAQFTVSNANNTVTLRQLIVEGLGP
jgi:N-acetylneuraminic acid mutarotase